jgi:hypothetical protein
MSGETRTSRSSREFDVDRRLGHAKVARCKEGGSRAASPRAHHAGPEDRIAERFRSCSNARAVCRVAGATYDRSMGQRLCREAAARLAADYRRRRTCSRHLDCDLDLRSDRLTEPRSRSPAEASSILSPWHRPPSLSSEGGRIRPSLAWGALHYRAPPGLALAGWRVGLGLELAEPIERVFAHRFLLPLEGARPGPKDSTDVPCVFRCLSPVPRWIWDTSGARSVRTSLAPVCYDLARVDLRISSASSLRRVAFQVGSSRTACPLRVAV